MDDITKYEDLIKKKIIESIQTTKTKLFMSNGKAFGRQWDDLTPKYKKWKKSKLGSAYPINIFTGNLLNYMLDKAIDVNVYYDAHLDKMNFKINIDSDRIGLEYADIVNEKREYIKFSDEEKKIITESAFNVLKENFGEGL